LELRFGTYRWRWKCIFEKIQDGGRRHLEFRKTVSISLLFEQSSPNLVGTLLLWFRTHRWRLKIYVTIIQDGGGRHFFTIRPIITNICENIGTSIQIISMTSEIHSFKNSRWRSPPSWISKNCCHFFTIWSFVTKISGNIWSSIWNISMTSEMHIWKNSRWRSPPSWT